MYKTRLLMQHPVTSVRGCKRWVWLAELHFEQFKEFFQDTWDLCSYILVTKRRPEVRLISLEFFCGPRDHLHLGMKGPSV